MRVPVAIGTLIGLLGAARADPATCDEGPLGAGPLAISAGDGQLGLVRRACVRSEVAVNGRGAAIVDTPHFYGNVAAAGEVSASWLLGDRLEVFGDVSAAQVRYLVNATLAKTQVTLGGASAGATYVALDRPGLTVAAFARAHLPTSLESGNARVIGLEPGVTATGALGHGLVWNAGLALALDGALSSGPAETELLASPVASLAWQPARYFAAQLELAAHASTLYGFEQATAGLALRTGYRRVGVELDVVVPLAGAFRYLAGGGLRLAYRL